MKTVHETMRDLDPMLMADLVMSDPAHQARVMDRRERARTFQQTKTERELERVKAQRDKDRLSFQERVSRLVIDHNATTALLVSFALAAGYILALM